MGCEKNSGNTPDSTTQSLCSCCCRNRPLPTWQSPWLLCVSLRAATTFQTSPVYCSFVNLGAEVMLFPVQEMWLLHFWVSPSPVAVTEQPDQLTLISSFMTCNHLNSFWQLSHIWERQLIIASSWFSWKLRSQMVCPFLVALVWFSGRPGTGVAGAEDILRSPREWKWPQHSGLFGSCGQNINFHPEE